MLIEKNVNFSKNKMNFATGGVILRGVNNHPIALEGYF